MREEEREKKMKVKRETIIRDVYTDVEYDGETYTVYEYLDSDQRSMLFEIRDQQGVLVVDDETVEAIEDIVTTCRHPVHV